MPAGSREPAKDTGASGHLVQMHRLRVEFGCELNDFLRRHGDRAQRKAAARLEVFKN